LFVLQEIFQEFYFGFFVSAFFCLLCVSWSIFYIVAKWISTHSYYSELKHVDFWCCIFASINSLFTFCFQAIWYTAEKGQEGPVFGSNDKWNGLAVFFDSFDNDGQVGDVELDVTGFG